MLAQATWTFAPYGTSPYSKPLTPVRPVPPLGGQTIPEAMRRATALLQVEKVTEAIALYQAILELAPDHSVANHNLATILMGANQHEAALPYLRTSLMGCKVLMPYVTYAWALLGLGRAAEAARFLADTIAKFGSNLPHLNILEARARAMLLQVNDEGVAKIPKVFCIGHNKTGTTSVDVALKAVGYKAGKQHAGERLIEDWHRGDFSRIIQHCQEADAFQDIPFSLKHTYRVLDAHFPGSKFILTVRTDSDTWFRSINQFHKKIVGKNRIPNAGDLKTFNYLNEGWLWRMQQMVYGIDEDSLYSPDIYKQYYASHNAEIIEYFKDRPDDLLVLNLAEPDAMQRLCRFLGFSACGVQMPHENRT